MFTAFCVNRASPVMSRDATCSSHKGRYRVERRRVSSPQNQWGVSEFSLRGVCVCVYGGGRTRSGLRSGTDRAPITEKFEWKKGKHWHDGYKIDRVTSR